MGILFLACCQTASVWDTLPKRKPLELLADQIPRHCVQLTIPALICAFAQTMATNQEHKERSLLVSTGLSVVRAQERLWPAGAVWAPGLTSGY